MTRLSGALTVVISILVLVAFIALRPPPLQAFGLVFPILTSIFITSCSIVVTFVAARAYSRERLLRVLFLGCGALVFGCTSLLASAFLGTEGQNFSATIFATGAGVSAAFNLACALLTSLTRTPRVGRGYNVSLWIPLALVSVISITIAAFEDLLPPFYVAGTGTTSVGQVVLGASLVAFASSAAMIFRVYSSSKSGVLYWYSLALAATASGLLGILLSNGDISATSIRAGWVALYIGGVLLLKSVLSAESMGQPPVARGSNRLEQ